MSNSFRDAVRNVMEGAKEKTLDGMTPDAKRFRHDLHPIKDPGVKLMVQKDSETKDYEKMFKPDMSKAKERLADMSSDKALDKYVEYNEAVRMEEKKHMKGCTCESCMTKEEKEDEKAEAKSDKKIAEASVMPASAGKAIAARVNTQRADAKQTSAISAREPSAPAKPFGGIGAMGGAGTAAAQAAKGTTSIATGGAKSVKPAQAPAGAPDKASSGKPLAASKPGEDKMASGAAAATKAAPKFDFGKGKGMSKDELAGFRKATGNQNATLGQAMNAKLGKVAKAGGANDPAAISKNLNKNMGPGSTGQKAYDPGVVSKGGQRVATASGANAPAKPAMPTRPGQQTSGAAAAAPKPGAGAGPGRAPTPAVKQQGAGGGDRLGSKVGAAKPFEPSKGGAGMSLAGYSAKRAGTMGARSQLTQSYEIEINGQNYYVSEAHAAAIAAYVEKYGMIDEKSDPAVGEFISKEMKHPEKLTAQGKKQKIKQAIAIYYSKKRDGKKP